jgi:GTP-binding protein
MGADALLMPKYSNAKGDDLLFTAMPENIYMPIEVLEQAKELDGVAAMSPQFYCQTLALGCCDPGEEGEERRLHMELKTIADAGLVGFPNAGKSTLISTVSAARPKVAPYPFTTLHPVVGIVEYSDYHRISMADIPGLLEGAHRNVGLGHSFLKHIERTKLLIFVLDMAGVDGRDPVNDLKVLRDELEHYMPGLEKRSALIVANKMDLEGAEENLERLRQELSADPVEIVPLSAGMNELGEFREKLRSAVEIARNRYY